MTLIFALMLSLSATAHANESISDYDSPKASRENSYRIDFQNDILFNSPTMRSNLSTISESLDEVVFTVDAGDDTFTANNYPNDGRFKVTAQRGYRLLGSGTWSVFADEHEAIRSLGIPSNLNWVPADENAWTYAAANDDWNFDSSTDPVK